MRWTTVTGNATRSAFRDNDSAVSCCAMKGERYSRQVLICATLASLRAVLLLGLLLFAQGIGQADQLPVRNYTTADGLPRDLVLRIVPDSHGFLWFCTADGLSRFNGYEFTTYGVEQGLP